MCNRCIERRADDAHCETPEIPHAVERLVEIIAIAPDFEALQHAARDIALALEADALIREAERATREHAAEQ